MYSPHLRGEKDISLEGRKNVNHSSEIQVCVFDDLFSTLPGGETLSPHPSQGGEYLYLEKSVTVVSLVLCEVQHS